MLNPMSAEAMVNWLEGKEAGEKYSFTDGRHCLMFQYLKASGFPIEMAGSSGEGWFDHEWQRHWSPDFYQLSFEVANGRDKGGNTFGAALSRAKAIANSGA